MFKVIGCSTMGKYHIGDHNVFIGKNNQDAYSIKESENAIVGIICDGCGSLPYSEFGATLGSQFLSQNISEKIETTHKIVTNNCVFMNWPELILQATDELLIKIKELCKILQPPRNYFLFTIIGFIKNKNQIIIFSIGDGFYGIKYRISGEQIFKKIEPMEGNAPPYLFYKLENRKIDIKINEYLQVTDVESLIIGTDGLADYEKNIGCKIPGKQEVVSTFDVLWGDKFKTEDELSRYMRSLNRTRYTVDLENKKLNVETGLLIDDTTIIVLKRENNNEN